MICSNNSIDYSTHIKLLTKYLLLCPNNATIIETGCGLFSSLIISELAVIKNLNHIIYYSDNIWKNNIEKLINNNVTQFIYTDWKNWEPINTAYLYFHDNEELIIDRYKHLHKIIKCCKFLIIHDYNTYIDRGCELKDFTILEIDSLRKPWTSVIKGVL